MQRFYSLGITFGVLLSAGSVFAQNNLIVTSPASPAPGQNNTFVGIGALNSSTANSGIRNTNVGAAAGANNTSGSNNAMFGAEAGFSNQTGASNTFVGRGAGYSNTGGFNNAYFGAQSGSTSLNGTNNVAVGAFSGVSNFSGRNNISIGVNSALLNFSGSSNTYMGTASGYNNDQGDFNVLLGDSTGFSNRASGNTFIGSRAGYTNTSGNQNTMVGYRSGYAGNGGSNAFLGYESGQGNAGSNNTFLGFHAGRLNQTGGFNVFVGSQAGYSNNTGTGNMFLGQQAGYNNNSGSYNLFIGNGAGGANRTGVGNVAIGDGANNNATAGDNNVYIGRFAGFYNLTGNGNVFIGQASGPPSSASALTNAIAIGTGAVVAANNSLILGNNVNVGIGTSAPTSKLELVSSAANTSGLKLTNLTSSSPASVTGATKFLSVDASGNVVLASLNASPRLATETTDAVGVSESYWTLGNGRLSRAGNEPVVIGSGIAKVSGAYGLYVEKGILTEKVRVAVKNSSEWADYVFAPSYKLRKLEEVEAFIKSHGHLPGVPSAEQVVSEGVDMAKMDAKLLEKIEELTLYVIELEKKSEQIDALKKENAEMKQQITEILKAIKK